MLLVILVPVITVGQIAAYYGAVLAEWGRVERCGPFRVYACTDPDWHFTCACPAPGADRFTGDQVLAAVARQHELGEPGAILWVHEVTPALTAVAARAGAPVTQYPLLGCPATTAGGHRADDRGAEVLGREDDPALAAAAALIEATPFPPVHPRLLGPLARQAGSSRLVLAAARAASSRVAAAAAHLPAGEVTMLTGIGARPGEQDDRPAAVARALTRHAALCELVPFLPAGSPEAAGPYRRAGYQPVGTLVATVVAPSCSLGWDAQAGTRYRQHAPGGRRATPAGRHPTIGRRGGANETRGRTNKPGRA